MQHFNLTLKMSITVLVPCEVLGSGSTPNTRNDCLQVMVTACKYGVGRDGIILSPKSSGVNSALQLHTRSDSMDQLPSALMWLAVVHENKAAACPLKRLNYKLILRILTELNYVSHAWAAAAHVRTAVVDVYQTKIYLDLATTSEHLHPRLPLTVPHRNGHRTHEISPLLATKCGV